MGRLAGRIPTALYMMFVTAPCDRRGGGGGRRGRRGLRGGVRHGGRHPASNDPSSHPEPRERASDAASGKGAHADRGPTTVTLQWEHAVRESDPRSIGSTEILCQRTNGGTFPSLSLCGSVLSRVRSLGTRTRSHLHPTSPVLVPPLTICTSHVCIFPSKDPTTDPTYAADRTNPFNRATSGPSEHSTNGPTVVRSISYCFVNGLSTIPNHR